MSNEEKTSLFSGDNNYGLGSIIEITSRNSKQRKSNSEKYARVPMNLWGTLLLSVLVILSPFLIYKIQSIKGLFSSDEDDPDNLTGFDIARPRWGIAGLGRVSHDFCVALLMTGTKM